MFHQPATSNQQIAQEMDKDREVQEENEGASCTSSVNEHLKKGQAEKNCGSERFYSCKVCQRMFRYPLDLKNHMKKHKMNKLSFKC